MDPALYIERIGYSSTNIRCDLDTLNGLVHAHQYHVPFENLQMHTDDHKKEYCLDLEKIYHKIVIEGRGGYCFELNGLFEWLLRQLGFQCHLMGAQVYSMDLNRYWDIESHCCIKVELDDGQDCYMVDVGIGETPPAIPFKSVDTKEEFFPYRMTKIDDYFIFQHFRKQKWGDRYRFKDEKRKLSDLNEGNDSLYHPEGRFMKGTVISLPVADGRYTMSGMRLIITKDGQKRDHSAI
eukprot:TRINITY_DN3733_c0_g1_i1.p1 TRINITY_DN3733_c0_g1~~TRINITY_DN3733_c0_g1_i1.p1  ORF type:complete len:237 (-),score=58.58 TRINITY_DN3733_c0_g1_i1:131-841(-)